MKKLTICCLLLALLCACSAPQNLTETNDEPLERYFAERLEQEPETVTPAGEETRKLESELLAQVRYEVTDHEDHRAVVTVEAPDMERLLDKMMRRCNTVSDARAFLIEALENGDFQTRTVTVEVELDEDGNPVESYDLVDAIYGGLLSKFEEVTQEVSGNE